MKIFKEKGFYVFSLFFILLSFILLFSFYDLQASEKFYKGETLLSAIFAYIGKLPAFAIMFFAAGILSKCVDIDYEHSTIALKWLYRIIMVFAGAMFFFSILENYFKEGLLLVALCASFGFFMGVVFSLVLVKVKREKLLCIEKWCFMAVVVTIAAFLSVSALKVLVGRMRYVDILANPSANNYSAWYDLNILGEGNSFPSGHVGLAATLCLIPMLFKSLGAKLYIKLPVYLLCICFVGLTLFSRVLGGHHFMTDVLFSLLIVFTIYFLSKFLFYSDKNLKFENATAFEKALKLGFQKQTNII